jgi:hypothetical protein
MLGMLIVIFSHNRIASRSRFTREGLVFIDDLLGISADLNVGSVAFEILRSGRPATTTVTIAIVIVDIIITATAPHWASGIWT